MEIIVEQNPWWENPEAIDMDPFVKAYDESLVKWHPNILDDIDPGRNIVYSLRGPRQVGKTTLLKLMIRCLIEKGVDPRSILYISCESLSSWKEFRDVLKAFFSMSTETRTYLFLDEVTAISDWSRPVKYLYDVGILRNSFVILSGSHAIDLLTGVERLVGRRGEYVKTPDFVLLPMTFGEYIRAVDPKLYQNLISGDPLDSLMIHHKAVKHHYENYIKAGGFPQAQDSLLKLGHVKFHIIREFVNYIRQDITKGGLSLELAIQILRKMLAIFPGTISWRAIASEIGYSHVSVSSHAEKIRALFLVEYLYPPKTEERFLVPDLKKDKKIVFIDPFIIYALHYWFYGTTSISRMWRKWVYDPQGRGRLLEALVLRHLIYWVYGSTLKEEILDSIFYFRKNDKEIDFIAIKGDIALIVESKKRKKFIRSLTTAEALVRPRRAIKILTTEGELEKKPQFIVMPVPYLLFLLSTDKITKKFLKTL